MTDAVDTVWPKHPIHQVDTVVAALRGAGLGVAVLGPAGALLAGDATFLDLHGIDASVAATFPSREQATLPSLLQSAACRLPDAEVQALVKAWAELLAGQAEAGGRRLVVSLGDGRTAALGVARMDDGRLVLTAAAVEARDKETGHAPSRLIHDMNNVVGGMLANLYLCLADLPSDHPVRARLEIVNRSTVELRDLVRQLTGQRSG